MRRILLQEVGRAREADIGRKQGKRGQTRADDRHEKQTVECLPKGEGRNEEPPWRRQPLRRKTSLGEKTTRKRREGKSDRPLGKKNVDSWKRKGGEKAFGGGRAERGKVKQSYCWGE